MKAEAKRDPKMVKKILHYHQKDRFVRRFLCLKHSVYGVVWLFDLLATFLISRILNGKRDWKLLIHHSYTSPDWALSLRHLCWLQLWASSSVRLLANFGNGSKLYCNFINLCVNCTMYYFPFLKIYCYFRVPLYSRNWHDLVFRVVEIGVGLWFPCVLWNCMRYAFSLCHTFL